VLGKAAGCAAAWSQRRSGKAVEAGWGFGTGGVHEWYQREDASRDVWEVWTLTATSAEWDCRLGLGFNMYIENTQVC